MPRLNVAALPHAQANLANLMRQTHLYTKSRQWGTDEPCLTRKPTARTVDGASAVDRPLDLGPSAPCEFAEAVQPRACVILKLLCSPIVATDSAGPSQSSPTTARAALRTSWTPISDMHAPYVGAMQVCGMSRR